jgi:hypothetical protein
MHFVMTCAISNILLIEEKWDNNKTKMMITIKLLSSTAIVNWRFKGEKLLASFQKNIYIIICVNQASTNTKKTPPNHFMEAP